MNTISLIEKFQRFKIKEMILTKIRKKTTIKEVNIDLSQKELALILNGRGIYSISHVHIPTKNTTEYNSNLSSFFRSLISLKYLKKNSSIY